MMMRTYAVNSPQAAGRLLALMMIVDGNLASAELQALQRSKILEHIDMDVPEFQRLLQELCDDMLTATATLHGAVQLSNPVIDSLLAEIADPDLRRKLLHAMWKIADADGWLADGEAVLLTRASNAWSAETNFHRHTR
ncbi:TerB family tellurite resistance protein [Janthinobacterium sp.]|uniref:TerB family tellurite resistance protein n=1 Tax=Janthinobacterium sp. TaxID=1871054 RepID=UPI00260812CF|nr:TerB family tellurite resistance protein [Janthinobacterium sp.]